MLAVMLFSVVITLFGQPESYWHHSETAIREDGLSVENLTNHTFEFFLGQGWKAFLITSMLYLFSAFLLVSLMPGKLALMAIFSFIFGHYFGGSNWLAVRWHLGISGSGIYGMVLVPILVLSPFPTLGPTNDRVIKALRWVMVSVMSLDMICTLLSQSASYWQHPETVHEGNSFSRLLLINGWYTYLLSDLIFFSGMFWLVLILPRIWALIFIFYFIFVNFIGAFAINAFRGMVKPAHLFAH
jgi:hypothetical protein